MRTAALILSVILAAISAWPQTRLTKFTSDDDTALPDAPIPQDPVPQDWDAIMRRTAEQAPDIQRRLKKIWKHDNSKIVDTGFIIDHIVFSASVVADAETTARAIESDPSVTEWNSLFGRRPGRLRIYGTEIPLTAAIVALDYYMKRQAQPYLRDQNIPNEVDDDITIPWWRILPLNFAAVHAWIAWSNVAGD